MATLNNWSRSDRRTHSGSSPARDHRAPHRCRERETQMEMVFAVVAAISTIAGFVGSWLSQLSTDERQPVLQVLRLRFKTIRMRILLRR